MKYTTAAFYNRFAVIYPAINFFLKRQRNVLIREVNHEIPGQLLEIGIGDGSHLPLYKSHKIVGIDVSESMLRKARRYASMDTNLILMNGEHLMFPDSCFDYVVLSHVIAVTKNPDQLLEQVFRVLKPGGKLFILNHFTPANGLKYIDRALQPISTFLHLRTAFYVQDIKGLHRFNLVKKADLGIGSYFKLLIYFKS